jgi:hypothetical protein
MGIGVTGPLGAYVLGSSSSSFLISRKGLSSKAVPILDMLLRQVFGLPKHAINELRIVQNSCSTSRGRHGVWIKLE